MYLANRIRDYESTTNWDLKNIDDACEALSLQFFNAWRNNLPANCMEALLSRVRNWITEEKITPENFEQHDDGKLDLRLFRDIIIEEIRYKVSGALFQFASEIEYRFLASVAEQIRKNIFDRRQKKTIKS